MKSGSTYLSIFLVAVQLLQYDVTSAWGKTETAVWRTNWKKTRPSIYQRATDAQDTGIIASDYIWWQRRTSRGGAKIGHERTAEIELSDSQAPCKTREGKPCKKNISTVRQNVSSSPRESSYRGWERVLRDAWWPQNLHGDAWLNPNYRRDAGPDMTMRCVICYCTRYPWQVNALWPRRVPLFDLDRYQLFGVNRVLGVLTKINKPWQPWHCFLFFFHPLLTFAWPLVSLIFVVGPNNHNTKSII